MFHVIYLDLAGFRREAVLVAPDAEAARSTVRQHAENGVSDWIDTIAVSAGSVYHIA